VIWADQEWPFHRSQILESVHFEPYEHTEEKVEALIDGECEG
jgi:hypothetical protein